MVFRKKKREGRGETQYRRRTSQTTADRGTIRGGKLPASLSLQGKLAEDDQRGVPKRKQLENELKVIERADRDSYRLFPPQHLEKS